MGVIGWRPGLGLNLQEEGCSPKPPRTSRNPHNSGRGGGQIVMG